MGNHLATLSSQAELNLPELGPTVLFLERLGGGRFIKSLKCSHENHILVVKVYCKSAAAESVEGYGEELALLLSKLSATHAPNVQPFRWFKETSTAAFIARQYIHSNLLELLSTPPFLTGWEKRWIAFQLLQALVQCHSAGVCHGDIKPENVMVSSSGWLYLCDFASFKPAFLPVDEPANCSYFFSSARRACSLAPERFVDAHADGAHQRSQHHGLTSKMDVFSTGCA